MPPIRKGDGTPVTPKGISQVRTGDGRILFDGVATSDSDDLQAAYDFSDDDVTTTEVPDISGNGHDLTGSFSSLDVDINGLQAGDFDGVDDVVNVDFEEPLSQPYHIFAVVAEWQSTDDGITPAVNGTDTEDGEAVRIGESTSENWFISAGENLGFGPEVTTEVHITDAVFDGDNSEHFLNNESLRSGDAGTNDLAGVQLGQNASDDEYAEIHIGEIWIYETDKTDNRDNIYAELEDKWGPTA